MSFIAHKPETQTVISNEANGQSVNSKQYSGSFMANKIFIYSSINAVANLSPFISLIFNQRLTRPKASYLSRLRRSVTPRACGARRSIHPLHRAPIELATVVPRALARCRFSTAYFVEIANFAPFSAFLHINGRNIPDVFIRSRLHMTPINHEKFHGNRSAGFSEIRKTDRHTDKDGQTDAATLYYIDTPVCANHFGQS